VARVDGTSKLGTDLIKAKESGSFSSARHTCWWQLLQVPGGGTDLVQFGADENICLIDSIDKTYLERKLMLEAKPF
jgi:hypothetical protein